MYSYKIEIEGFSDYEPTINVKFQGMEKKGNTDLQQITSIAYELKKTLKKLQKVSLYGETDETE